MPILDRDHGQRGHEPSGQQAHCARLLALQGFGERREDHDRGHADERAGVHGLHRRQREAGGNGLARATKRERTREKQQQEQLERLGEQRRIERQSQPRRGDGQEADHRLCGHGPAGREADRAREGVREQQREPEARHRESLDGGHRADGLRDRPGQHMEGGRVGERHPLAADPARPGAGPRLVRARVERERRFLVERVHQLRVGVDVGVIERRVRERDQREDDRRRGHPGGRGAEDARKAARERAGQNAKGHDQRESRGRRRCERHEPAQPVQEHARHAERRHGGRRPRAGHDRARQQPDRDRHAEQQEDEPQQERQGWPGVRGSGDLHPVERDPEGLAVLRRRAELQRQRALPLGHVQRAHAPAERVLRVGRDLVALAPDRDLRRRPHEAGHAQAQAKRTPERDRHGKAGAVLGPVERRLAEAGPPVVLPPAAEAAREDLVAGPQVDEQRGVPPGEERGAAGGPQRSPGWRVSWCAALLESRGAATLTCAVRAPKPGVPGLPTLWAVWGSHGNLRRLGAPRTWRQMTAPDTVEVARQGPPTRRTSSASTTRCSGRT